MRPTWESNCIPNLQLSTQVLVMSLSVLYFQPLFWPISNFEEDSVCCNKNYWLRLESSRSEAANKLSFFILNKTKPTTCWWALFYQLKRKLICEPRGPCLSSDATTTKSSRNVEMFWKTTSCIALVKYLKSEKMDTAT